MEPGSYNLLQLEAPDVEQNELRSAVRWRIKDLIDFHIDDAVIDVFDMPPQSLRTQTRLMYVVAARASVIQQRTALLEEAGLRPQVVDITELALRNLLSLFPEDVDGVVLLYAWAQEGLLTLNRQTLLYLARNIEFNLAEAVSRQAPADDAGFPSPAAESVLLEVQRSMDYFEAHFAQAPIKQMLIAAPAEAAAGLGPMMSSNLGIKARALDLAEVMDLPGSGLDGAWVDALPLIGAALRSEVRSL